MPELWGEGLLSTSLNELNAVYSPDGNEVYWSIQLPEGLGVIMRSRLNAGRWSEPTVAPFSGEYTDWDPFFFPDGKRLLFISNRPKPTGEPRNPRDFDIWEVRRVGDDWGTPVYLDSPVNTKGAEYYPSIAKDSTLYFSAAREGSKGFDLYRSRLVNGKYGSPEPLGSGINSPGNEIDNYIAPDQSFIIFNSSGRPDDLGSGDLYVSFQRDGTWTQAVHLPAGINTAAREYCPIGSPDGKWLYFTSERWSYTGVPPARMNYRALLDRAGRTLNGGGNIYRITLASVLAIARRNSATAHQESEGSPRELGSRITR